MGDVLSFVNPFSQNFLGAGQKQSQQSSSSQQLSSFAQFPDLQKAIAEFGFGNIQSAAPALQNRAGAEFQYPQLNATGLFPEQQAGFDQAVRQAASQISGNYAGHGMLLPQHIGAIAGSAAQQVMPQFANLIGAQVGQQALVPEQVTQNRINQLLQLISTYPGLMGGQATSISQGQTNFPSFIQSIFNAIPGAAQGFASRQP